MSNTFLNAITVVKTGVSQASGAVSAGAALPTAQSGEIPRYIRVTTTVAAFFRIGAGAQTALATDLMLEPGNAVVLSVPGGFTHFAVIQVASAGIVIVSPMENM